MTLANCIQTSNPATLPVLHGLWTAHQTGAGRGEGQPSPQWLSFPISTTKIRWTPDRAGQEVSISTFRERRCGGLSRF